jgi:hypothetical protein
MLEAAFIVGLLLIVALAAIAAVRQFSRLSGHRKGR